MSIGGLTLGDLLAEYKVRVETTARLAMSLSLSPEREDALQPAIEMARQAEEEARQRVLVQAKAETRRATT